MDKKAMEARLNELAGKQAAIMSKKKAERNAEELATVRQEMNDLKAKVTALYKGKAN